MEILGVGGWEVVTILLVMLVVAGPKRMIQWAYHVGRYVAKLRAMWAETMSMVQKELDAAGVDVQLPKEPPTRQGWNQMASKALEPFTQPMQQAMKDVDAELKQVKDAVTITGTNGQAQAKDSVQKPPDDESQSNFGTWSQPPKTQG